MKTARQLFLCGLYCLPAYFFCIQAQAKAAPQTMPQTARQALLEMFFSKDGATFMRHLPAATQQILEQAGVLKNISGFAGLANQAKGQSDFETFETGSILLSTRNPKTSQKIEVVVEQDSLNGDEDDIETTFQAYANGQVQRTPIMPKLTFAMKQEGGVWKLNEIRISMRLPLADPALLKSFAMGLQASAALGGLHATSASDVSPTTAAGPVVGSDETILTAVRNIVSAEQTYAKNYPPVGYTCTLSDLDGFGGGEPNEHQAMLINSGLASGRHRGYNFTLSDCAGTPGTSYHLTASPSAGAVGRKVYCADESGSVFSSTGAAASCFSSGSKVQ